APWLLRIVANETRNLTRSRRRRAALALRLSAAEPVGRAADGPDDEGLAAGRRSQLGAAVDALPDRERRGGGGRRRRSLARGGGGGGGAGVAAGVGEVAHVPGAERAGRAAGGRAAGGGGPWLTRLGGGAPWRPSGGSSAASLTGRPPPAPPRPCGSGWKGPPS